VSADKKQLIDAVNKNITDLQKGTDRHRCLVASILEQGTDEGRVREFLALYPSRTRESKLMAAIKQAIDVLEESRKAFKSKTLERLHKKLLQALIDLE
jgi:phage-related protein